MIYREEFHVRTFLKIDFFIFFSMDSRRKLHKVNGQAIGKNRQISTRTRANNRAAHQDAHREIEPEEEVPVKLTRLERLKLWRIEREEKRKVDDQNKKKPFVSVVKRGVFTDTTNYKELNKQRRKKVVGPPKAISGKNLTLQVGNESTITTDNDVSRRGQGFLSETEVSTGDNHTANAGLLSIPDNSSILNSTFDTQNSERADIDVDNSNNAVHDAGVHSIATPGVNTLTVPIVSSQLNTTFETENSAENNVALDVVRSTGIGDVLTVPENTSVLNTTFEMENSDEKSGASMEVSGMLDAHAAKATDIPEGGRSSIRFTPRSVKLENASERKRPLIKSTPKSVKSENASERMRPSIKSTPKSVKTQSIPESSIESTPKSVLSTSLNYVSPFVTISRGKGSAQKEVKVRESFYKLELSVSEHDSPVVRQNHAAADYFRRHVNLETNNLLQRVEYWTKYKTENDHVDSVYLDQMDVAIGQTRLLITKKFKQFLGLCDQCEKGTNVPPVLPKDLEGFWSMVYMQVENCGARFQKLTTLQENDWVEVDLLPTNVVIKPTRNRKVVKKGAVASSGIQKMIEEARLKMKESKISTTAPSSR